MADRNILTHAGKGASLDSSDQAQNSNAFSSTTEEQTGATYEVVYTDQGKLIELNNASMVCTLDAIADIVVAMDTGVDNFSVTLKNTNSATATITPTTDNIDGATGLSLAQHESITLQTNAADDEWHVKSSREAIYAGRVPAALIGGATLPAGWSAANPGTGVYTITHSLGLASTQYAVVLTIANSSGNTYLAKATSIGTDSFTCVTESEDGTNVDVGHSFIMMVP